MVRASPACREQLMIVRIPLLLLAVLLLFFPRQWMRLGLAFLKRRRRREDHAPSPVEPWKAREPGDPRVSFAMEFVKLRNYIDLLRGAAGSLALSGGMSIPPSISLVPDAPRTVLWQTIIIRSLIMLVGLLIQTLRYERNKVTFYPPIFYLAGVSVGLCDIRGAAFAFALIWAVNPALPNAQGFLTVYAIMLVVFGHLFAGGGDLSAAYAGMLTFLPVLLSLLSNRPLTVFTRKATRTVQGG
jgi:hypothetical protein